MTYAKVYIEVYVQHPGLALEKKALVNYNVSEAIILSSLEGFEADSQQERSMEERAAIS